MDLILIIPRAVWLMIPMMVPNSAAVLFGGGAPIDFGRKMKDGTRILGGGKTWRGLFGGVASGMVVGLIQGGIAWQLDAPDWWYGELEFALVILLLLSLGAMLGDLLASFLKRRMMRKRGAKFPILDQYDFVLGALALVVLFQYDWFYSNFIVDEYIIGLVGLIIIIPILHRATNIIGYKMGKKDVPW